VDYGLSVPAGGAYSESALQLRSKDESETETRSQARSSRGSSRSVSPEGRDNRYVIDTRCVLFSLLYQRKFHVFVCT